ncbi:MAG: RNA polymerase sigma factor [Phycisphaerae bacterium]|nr:RNA polymerase sigma factor [Phycisphaerae bacterium]
MRADREQLVDELLVLRSQGGDAAAMKALVERWQRPLWTHAYRLTDDAEAAWDVVQEAWVAIIRGLRRLEDAACFRTWAFRIVTHKAADAIGRKVRDRRLREAAAEKAADAVQGAAGGNEADDATRRIVDRLGVRDRQVLTLHYLEGFSVAEIAGVLQIPEGTVKSRLFKARARLKESYRVNDNRSE